MNVIQLLSPEQAIDSYIQSRGSTASIISTGRAILNIRSAIPRCALTDRELADLIAASAIEQGRGVAFDDD